LLQGEGVEEAGFVEPVKTEAGYVRGEMIGESGAEVLIYRGVPYAAPPVGDLRWKPPQPVRACSETLDCLDFKPMAPQSVLGSLPPGPQPLPSSEDCLYLNILTPARKASDRLPVMVWLHGGGYQVGMASNPLENAPRLPQKGIVLVNVNMRLNAMGLLAHPLLSQESPQGISGNYLFWDILAALEWVHKNIERFGGNPANVTIFGESGGGAKVANLMASPLANGLFHRAICQSGTSVGAFSPGKHMKELEAMGERFFRELGVDRESDPLAAARALPWEKIVETDGALIRELHMFGPEGLWDAAIDGWFLPGRPDDIFRTGGQNVVPLIVCANLGELSGPGLIVLPSLIPGYLDMLEAMRRVGAKAYACIFDQVPSKWKQTGCVSTHAMELGYVFGDWDGSTEFWSFVYMLASKSGADSPDPGLTEADKKISEAMMAMWTQFARRGDPNAGGPLDWPAYDASRDEYLCIREPLEVKSGFSRLVSRNGS
jgi:para-nitrobenzyl esterase